MEKIEIGIIGGSGVYKIEGINIIDEVTIDTPFGTPSSSYIIGELDGVKVAFLARHGKGHTILPTELNNRANIYGFKKLGVKTLVSVSAVGSLREEIKPTHLVFPDQIIDRTKGRTSTFFGEGIVTHIGFAEPFCPHLRETFVKVASELEIPHHVDKTYVSMEGPAFSTKAESNFHRQIGGDIIGMTAIPEAKLAREAEICYATVALSTDYDCWHEEEEAVTVEAVLEVIRQNVATTNRLIKRLIPELKVVDCSCRQALSGTIMTAKELWPAKTVRKLHEILKRFF